MKAPPRLLDDPMAAPELRADLRRAGTAVSGYDVAAGLIALQSSVAASGAAAGSSASAGHAAVASAKAGGALGATGMKLTLSALGAAAVIAAGATLWPSQRTAPARPAVTAPTTASAAPSALDETATPPSAAPAQAGPMAEAEAPPAPSASSVEPRMPRATATHRARHATSGAAAPQADDALHREVAQLGRIKASLDGDPARAYRLAELGNREFRHGALVQEREALAVLALWNLGRHGEALSRGRAFLERYPQSPLRDRLQAVLHSDAP